MTSPPKSPIEHARAYPFAIPSRSFVVDNDGWREFNGPFETVGRHAVIASGSNASPGRLSAKFEDHAELLNQPIYVTRSVLKDFDVVYSAHITAYGSIPATLAHAPGVEAQVFVTWLTDDQLARMHETEALGQNYDYVQLAGIDLTQDGGTKLDTAHAYLSRWGCLNRGDQAIPLAEVTAQNRMWKALNQKDVLTYVQSLFKSDMDNDSFILKHIDCTETRKGRIVRLSISALEHGWPNGKHRVIAPIPTLD